MNKLQFYTPGHIALRQLTDEERAAGLTQSRTIEGYAIVFNTESIPLGQDHGVVYVERIAPEAITKELLDSQNISMTLFHNMEALLARSQGGQGTLSYEVDDRGVRFSFEAPHTTDGDKAVELVARGDLQGCSFMFTIDTADHDAVTEERGALDADGRRRTVYTVHRVTGVYDFTLTQYPAYPDTHCELRSLVEAAEKGNKEGAPATERAFLNQIREMRHAAACLPF